MSAIEAIAWDIDGTLLDSEPVHLRALQDVSLRYGLDLSGEPDERFLGYDLSQVWAELRARYPASLRRSAWMDEILRDYCGRTHEITLFADMTALMRDCAEAGIAQGCVSNSERLIVDANIAALEIGGIIAFSISREDVERSKPDPGPYLEACRRLGRAPGRVLAVEDSAPGATSAQAAGLKVVRIDAAERAPAIAAIRGLLGLDRAAGLSRRREGGRAPAP